MPKEHSLVVSVIESFEYPLAAVVDPIAAAVVIPSTLQSEVSIPAFMFPAGKAYLHPPPQ